MKKMGDKQALEKMSPQLVHRVLLTDPSQFSSLTVSGKPHGEKTPSFQDFSTDLKSPSSAIETTMKRAYRDQVCQVLYTTRNMLPLQQLMLEVHGALRSLVPNRSDLHSMLNDEKVRQTPSPLEILPSLIQAGEALAQLESEVRAESTLKWIQMAQDDKIRTMDLESAIEFLVTSMMYLLRKSELCEQDKQDFFLQNVWAPRIHKEGHDLERKAFESRYGKLKSEGTAPLTRQWIQELVAQSNNRDELRGSFSTREVLVRKGWVDDILFRASDRSILVMPEILELDHEQLDSIRLVTRSAAAGSALALHACNAAGVSSSVLSEPIEPASPLELRRIGIAESMARLVTSKNRKDEEKVANSVVQLAREWNPSLSSDAETALRNRTTSVLRGEDPVLVLLDSRMKEVFSALMTWKSSVSDLDIRSGRAVNSAPSHYNVAKAFNTAAKTAFCKRGLSFYAADLASASYLAKKVVDLAWTNYGELLLDKIILDACED